MFGAFLRACKASADPRSAESAQPVDDLPATMKANHLVTKRTEHNVGLRSAQRVPVRRPVGRPAVLGPVVPPSAPSKARKKPEAAVAVPTQGAEPDVTGHDAARCDPVGQVEHDDHVCSFEEGGDSP